MGKNQAYKAMQRARSGSTSGGPDEIEDGMVDGSFHSPEWHAARLASLKTSHTITWEEYKKKQKEDEIKKGELEADKDRMMREYRAQLDAERAKKLGHGRNHSGRKSSRKKGRMRTLRSGAAAERERVQREDHQSHHLQVHCQSLQVVTRKKKSQEDLDRAQRRKGKRKGTGQEQSTPAATKKRIKVPSPCQNSLAVLKADDRSLFEDTVVWEFKKMGNSCFATHSCITLSEHKFVFFRIITTPFFLPSCVSARQ